MKAQQVAAWLDRKHKDEAAAKERASLAQPASVVPSPNANFRYGYRGASRPCRLWFTCALSCSGQVGGLRLPFGRRRAIERGDTDNHGHADYMTLAVMQALFPPVPDQDIGGVVVGEADRVDLGPAARMPFDPENRATWGRGGRAPLMIDPCRRGSTHSMVIGGGGTYKSTTLVVSLLTWQKAFSALIRRKSWLRWLQPSWWTVAAR